MNLKALLILAVIVCVARPKINACEYLTLTIHYYKVYGLRISAELALPELVPSDHGADDVHIVFGEVPEHLPQARGSGILFEAAPGDFLFIFEGIGRFRVQDGNRIVIQPDPGALPEEIRLVLLGSGMGALLHQRGILALHGSAISNGHQSAILSGPSGVGKSTLAAGLNELGYSIMADDIAVISHQGNQRFIVERGIPQLKLWKDVLLHMNRDQDLSKVRPRLEKYRWPVPRMEEDAPPLSTMLILKPSNTTGYSHTKILGREKFHLLRDNTYRLQFIEMLDQTEVHFRNLSLLVNSIQMYYISRPHDPLNIRDFALYAANLIFKS